VQREHFPEFSVGYGNGERRRRGNCDRDYIASGIGFGDLRRPSGLVVMVNCRPMIMPLPVRVRRN
jgi:hypothetical protein